MLQTPINRQGYTRIHSGVAWLGLRSVVETLKHIKEVKENVLGGDDLEGRLPGDTW